MEGLRCAVVDYASYAANKLKTRGIERLVSGLRRYDHVTPALRALGWPSIRSMVTRRDALNVYRGLNVSGVPKTLGNMFRPRSAVSGRSTRATAAGTAVLELPSFRLAAARRLFLYRAAVAWNSLPRDTTGAVSRAQLLYCSVCRYSQS